MNNQSEIWNLLVDIFNLFKRYEYITQTNKSVGIYFNNNQKPMIISTDNILIFPHALGLQKIDYFKKMNNKSINSYIKTRKVFQKIRNLKTSQYKEIKAKLNTWTRYTEFLEGNWEKTQIIVNGKFSQSLWFEKGLLWQNCQSHNLVLGLWKFPNSYKYKSDYLTPYTSLFMKIDVNKKFKSIEEILFVNKVFFNIKG
ncbi:Uncharacterised protein [Mesomycoplasma conjunctivae]|nr:Uncharacterised protein [Mesomycoplasma conjunctivae]